MTARPTKTPRASRLTIGEPRRLLFAHYAQIRTRGHLVATVVDINADRARRRAARLRNKIDRD